MVQKIFSLLCIIAYADAGQKFTLYYRASAHQNYIGIVIKRSPDMLEQLKQRFPHVTKFYSGAQLIENDSDLEKTLFCKNYIFAE